jgi:hypothetical protein
VSPEENDRLAEKNQGFDALLVSLELHVLLKPSAENNRALVLG